MSAHTPTSGAITKIISDNPTVLGTGAIEFSTITFIAYNAARTENTSTVYIQTTSGASDAGIPLAPGGSVTITAPSKGVLNDSQFYIGGTAGQGVIGFWMRSPL